MNDMKGKRKAKEAVLIEASKTSPGYFKYLVTILEVDGSETKEPAYGVDMQDAIRRLIVSEKAVKMDKFIETRVISPTITLLIGIGWIFSLLTAGFIDDYRYALYSVISVFSIVTFFAITRMILSGLKKRIK
jgi:hypothetical protein